MRFTLIVYADPLNSQAAYSAFKFASAALELGHNIHTVFFYAGGVNAASNLIVPQQDEPALHHQWHELAAQYELKLIVCIAAALKRGLLDEAEANRYDKTHYNISTPFELGGLGQLIDALDKSDRSITFGG